MQYKQVKLDQRQEAVWAQTRAAVSIAGPQFLHLMYSLLDNSGGQSKAMFVDDSSGIPVAATDAVNVIFNVKNYLNRPLPHRVFIFGHEIMHNVYNDIVYLHYCAVTGTVITSGGKKLPFIAGLLQKAMDYRINDLLVECKFGECPPDALWDKAIGTQKDSAADIYERLFKNGGGGKCPPGKQPGQPGNQPGNGQGQPDGGFDDILAPGATQGKTPSEGAQDRANKQGQWELELKAAVALARSQGRLPAAFERLIGELTEHKVPWHEHLQAELARRMGGGSYNWRRPDRRFIVRDIYVPSRAGFGCDHVVIGVDTSGSIHDVEIAMAMRETTGILDELRPERITVIWCDAAVKRVDNVSDLHDLAMVKSKGAVGGGGTDFCPVFDHIEKEAMEPDAVVYFTDGAGRFPANAPKYPVIWGAFENSKSMYPWGKVVEIPRGGA